MKKYCDCAACGAPMVEHPITFCVSQPELEGEFQICEGCWSQGENNAAWNDRITQQIILNHNAKNNARS